MKSAMVSRQGSISRLQGPRSLRSAGDGSPRRRAAKSVKFDKTDEVIQYVAATPEISEDNWDQVSLESCDSDMDGRPLPTLPNFLLTSDIATRSSPEQSTREERLMQIPRFQAKLGAPLGETDDDFDFGPELPSPSSSPTKPTEDSQDPAETEHKDIDGSAEQTENLDTHQDGITHLLPSPLQTEHSPIIDRPPMDLRMDTIMESGSGMSPSLSGGSSWHRRTGSQMSDFSDGGNESYLPLKRIPLPPKEDDDYEPASWRDQSDSALARQDSLQESQRHPPTQKLSDKPLPQPATDLDRTYSKRKRQVLQMLDPQGAGLTKSIGFNAIPEEAEEMESDNEVNNSRQAGHKELDVDIGDDSYWHGGFKRGLVDEEEHGEDEEDQEEDDKTSMLQSRVGNISADQSIGISNEPAAQYAAGLSPDLQEVEDDTINHNSALSEHEILPENRGEQHKILDDDYSEVIQSPSSNQGSFFDQNINPEPSSDSDVNENDFGIPSYMNYSNDSFNFGNLAPPSRLEETDDSRDSSVEASRITYYDSEELDKLDEVSDEDESMIVQPIEPNNPADHSPKNRDPENSSPLHINSSSPKSKSSSDYEKPSTDASLQESGNSIGKSGSEQGLNDRILGEKVGEPVLSEADSSEPSIIEPNESEHSLEGHSESESELDDGNHEVVVHETKDQTPSNKRFMYPGVLPWDPSMDTTMDNLAAMPTPEIPPRSPERSRRSLLLDRPLQARDNSSFVNPAEKEVEDNASEAPMQSEEEHAHNELNFAEWEPENDDDDDEYDDDEVRSVETKNDEPVESKLVDTDGIDDGIGHNTHVLTDSGYGDQGIKSDSDKEEAGVEESLIEEEQEDEEQEDEEEEEEEDGGDEEEDSLYGNEAGFDSNVLEYIANNTENEAAVADSSSAETPKMHVQERKGSTASLRDKHSFMPTALPSLSPINISNSPFLPFEDELKEPEAPQSYRIDELVTQPPSRSPAEVQPTKNLKLHSASPSVVTENGETSILKEMSFNLEELAKFQQKSLVEQQNQETEFSEERNVRKDQPELDSDLSDLENQEDISTESITKNEPENAKELPKQTHGDLALVETSDKKPIEALQELPMPNLYDGVEHSMREISLGENMASTLLSLFSDQFPPASESNRELDRSSSRHSYTLRESGSYVIATSPRRQRQNRSQAYEVLDEDESEYAVPQNPIQRNRQLPSAASFGAFSFSRPPSDISKTGSSSYSLAHGSSSGSVSQQTGGGSNNNGERKQPLSVIQEPEEEAEAIALAKESPIKIPRVRPSTTFNSPTKNAPEPPSSMILPQQDKNLNRSSNYELFNEDSGNHQAFEASETKGYEFPLSRTRSAIPLSSTQNSNEVATTSRIPSVSQQVKEIYIPKAAPATSTKPVDSPKQSTSEECQLPTGLLYLAFDGVTVGLLPADTVATLVIDNGVHCIASKPVQVSKLSHFNKEYRIGFIEGNPVTAVLKLSCTSPDQVKHLGVGSDGSFAKFDLGELRKSSYGHNKKDIELSGINAWGKDSNAVVATSKVSALYIHCVSQRETHPKTLKEAESRILEARKELSYRSPRAHGVLRQFGGDLRIKSGKQRYMVLDPISPLLVAHSIRTRRPRTLINLAKATSVTPIGDNYLEIRFRNRDSLQFYASNQSEYNRWLSMLEKAVGNSEGARPKWIDAVLYESPEQ